MQNKALRFGSVASGIEAASVAWNPLGWEAPAPTVGHSPIATPTSDTRPTRRYFDASEDDYIRSHWGSSLCSDIAKHLGRSGRGVRNRAEFLGLPIRKCIRWTPAEDKVLLAARGRSLSDVAEELQRGVSECSNRAKVLGIKSWAWQRNDGGYCSKRGYRIIGFTRAGGGKASKAIFEHIVVAEQLLGRPIQRGEVVHHINGVRGDNRPENILVCRDARHHRNIHCTLDGLLPELVESGILAFDHTTESYHICKT